MRQYIIDAFTDKVFHGNQAAVCVLKEWPSEELMMNITKENNFSETAFTVRETDEYGLRWFTPGGEISLCGHATLATAYVLFRFYEKSEKSAEKIVFHTISGDLFIDHDEDYIVMDFPAYQLNPVAVSDQMEEAFGIRPSEAYIDRDLLLVFDNEEQVRALQPDFEKVKLLPGEGVGVTARGKEYDCVSRFFDPKLKVNEDPVPYQEPAQSPAVPVRQYTCRDEVKAWAADQVISVGQNLFEMFWNEMAMPFIQAGFHQLGEKAVSALTGANKQRPHEQIIIDVDPADLTEPESHIHDEKIIHFSEERAV